MTEFFASFSNREIALLVWIFIAIILMLFNKSIRQSISGIFKAFFARKLLFIFFIFVGYIAAIVFALFVLGFWERSLLKDTIFWTFGFAIVLVFRIDQIKRMADFKPILKDAVKWTVVIEFLVAFYTFSLIAELILLPILVFVGMIQGYADTDKNYNQVNKFLKSTLNLLGLGVLGYVIYKTFFQGGELISIINFKSFMLPIILTVLFIPFVYFLTLFSTYENLFVRLRFFIKDKKLRTTVKWQILQITKLNLDKLTNISKNIVKERQLTFKNSFQKIEQMSKTS